MKVVIVVPTFNERDNIRRLIESLQEVFISLEHDMHILVADDRSPDGTAEIIRDIQLSYKNVHLLEGKKEGLGAAYIRGINYAVEKLQADLIFEMDADFSHNPLDIGRFIEKIISGYDFVIGSRYVKGGSIPKEWGWYRQVVSKTGNLVARYIAGIEQVRDCTGGFRAVTRKLIKQINWSTVQVQGYAFQVALLHAAISAGADVVEIPIHFSDRKYGKSKLGLMDIIEFILNAWWIRFRNLVTFLKFAAVRFFGVIINIGTFSLLLYMGINKFIASPVAIEVAILFNFLINNFWTFRWRKTNSGFQMKGLKFNTVSLLALGVSYSTFIVLIFIFPGWPPHIAQALGIPPAMFINYFLNSRWTFKNLVM
jgi:dolichol-phosphate mannosyltransferase